MALAGDEHGPLGGIERDGLDGGYERARRLGGDPDVDPLGARQVQAPQAVDQQLRIGGELDLSPVTWLEAVLADSRAARAQSVHR